MNQPNNEVNNSMENKPITLEMRGLYETAYLLAEGGILVKSWKDKTDPQNMRKIFLIEPPEGYRQKLKDYRNGIAVTNVARFLDKIRALKILIHEDPI